MLNVTSLLLIQPPLLRNKPHQLLRRNDEDMILIIILRDSSVGLQHPPLHVRSLVNIVPLAAAIIGIKQRGDLPVGKRILGELDKRLARAAPVQKPCPDPEAAMGITL